MDGGVEYVDGRSIAEIFNNYYVSIGPQLDRQLPQSPLSPTSFLSANQLSSFFLRPVNATEVSDVILNLKKKSP